MNEISNLAKMQQLLEGMERDLKTAKHILQQLMGEIPEAGRIDERDVIAEKAKSLTVSEGGKIIEGVFDGQNMVGPDGRMYPVPANYASKSKLVEGDVLKLTISSDGSFIYKQIGPVERKRIIGVLVQDERGDYRVVAEGKSYKVLLASLTYFKAEPGDQVTLIVPEEGDASWAAVENVMKQGDEDYDESIGPKYKPKEKAEEAEAEEGAPPKKEPQVDEENKEKEDRQVRIVSGDDDLF